MSSPAAASSIYDVHTTCRSCLRKSKKLCSLDSSDDKFSTGKSKSVAELIMACTSIQIAPDDGLPQNICIKCMSDLKAAFAYKTMCEESDVKLRSVLGISFVKVERCEEVRQTKIPDTEQYTFEVNWVPQLDVAEVPEAELIPKIEEIDPESTELESRISSPIAGNETIFVAPLISEDSERCDSPDMWSELPENDLENDTLIDNISNENETMNGFVGEPPKQNDQSRTDTRPQKQKKEKNVMCEFCSGTFYSMGQLQLHYVKHTKKKDFICDICKKQYSTKAVLKDHMRFHGDKSKLYSHVCPDCGKGFAYRKYLVDHIHVHSGERPFKCDICSKTFKSVKLLRLHKRNHDPVKPCVCKTCGKGFLKNDKLASHMRTHTGERPFDCNICGRKFSQRSHMRSHMKNHIVFTCHSCNICDEGFIEKRQLGKHRREMGHWVPGEEPPPKIPKAKKKRKTKKIKDEPVADIDSNQEN